MFPPTSDESINSTRPAEPEAVATIASPSGQ
jgi:hypothetical protein